MLIKLDTKSARVKGLSFHHKRPWILASLHSGQIQLWDYRMNSQIDKGIAFHQQQPIFVSGGDDYKIKLWNFKQKKCLFTLLGHLDYIRTTFFHHEYPWIVSASDDQTIRIWNWQSRNCISIVTGHNHYVMCAQFHPTDDLMASASLDQTIRIWDISGLRKKNAMPGPESFGNSSAGAAKGLSSNSSSNTNTAELFATGEVIVKHVLEGHDRGVNWVSFHSTLPLLVSGADDRQVKIWRMNDTKAWEVDTCRGHYNNVSCTIFHPKKEFILSDSEDKSVRVWDMGKRTTIQSFRKDSERFWTLACHPNMEIFAAGHDTGFMVFKLERERPAYISLGDILIYAKDKTCRALTYCSATDVLLYKLKGPGSSLLNSASTALSNKSSTAVSGHHNQTPSYNLNQVFSISYNPSENAYLVCRRGSSTEQSIYDLYIPGKSKIDENSQQNPESKRGYGSRAIWVARNRFAVLDKTHCILIKNLQNEIVKKLTIPANIDDIFGGPLIGCILLKDPESITLYDIQQKRCVSSVKLSKVKYVIWSNDMSCVAFFSKHSLSICNKRLELLTTIHENVRIKSGAFNENGVLIYNTSNHIKYVFPNGDHGIIRTLDTQLYITNVIENRIFCLDREAKTLVLNIDPTEFKFKLALINKDYNEIIYMVQNLKLIGQSIVSYLRQKGYPEIALHFVKDDKIRFGLALECGNIEAALESARKLDKDYYWNRLGQLALNHGDFKVVEICYQRNKEFAKLGFLYAITGDMDKVVKMTKIAENKSDISNQFRSALFLNDKAEQLKILKGRNQPILAYVFAKRHGMVQELDELENILREKNINIEDIKIDNNIASDVLLSQKAELKPCRPLYTTGVVGDMNWPLLQYSTTGLDRLLQLKPKKDDHQKGHPGGLLGTFEPKMDHEMEIGDTWGDEDFDLTNANQAANGIIVQEERLDENENENSQEGAAWDVDEELEIPTEETSDRESVGENGGECIMLPHMGKKPELTWIQSPHIVDHIIAGAFDSAFRLMQDEFGIVCFEPLKELILEHMNCNQLYIPTLPNLPPFKSYLNRTIDPGLKIPNLPHTIYRLEELTGDRLQTAYHLTTAGKFSESVLAFRRILHIIPFIICQNKSELTEIKALIKTCSEYITGLQMEQFRKGLPRTDNENQNRIAELAAYFTHCGLEPIHQILTLRTALNIFYKMRNFKTASIFAKRILDLGPKPDIMTQVKTIYKQCQKTMTDAEVLEYEPYNPFVICAQTYKPIYRGKESVNCPYCTVSYLPEFKGRLCTVCQVSQIGAHCTGPSIKSGPGNRR